MGASFSSPPTPPSPPTPSPPPIPPPSPFPPPSSTSAVIARTAAVRTVAPVQAACVGVTHDILDYVVDKEADDLVPELPEVGFAHRNVRCGRHILRVCHIYNQQKYKCMTNCHRFHVCLGWINGNCDNDDCVYEHSFDSAHNRALARPLIGPRFSETNLRDQLKTNLRFTENHRSRYEDESTTICPYNVLNRCTRSRCNQLHLGARFMWEVKDSTWVRFTREQSEHLEKQYCDPSNDSTQISLRMNSGKENSQQLNHLSTIFGSKNAEVEVNFQSMVLTSANSSLRYNVRRLSTPSDIFRNIGPNTRWVWYENLNNTWVFMRCLETDQFYEIAMSDYIERQLQNGEQEIKLAGVGKIDLIDFSIKDNDGYFQSSVRRRPAQMILSDPKKVVQQTHFKEKWTEVPSGKVFNTEVLSSSSKEFLFVSSKIQATLCANIIKIERIQNPFLWKAYQLKKKQMLRLHCGDVNMVKEQYLFHGTRVEVLQHIYEGNLDWRLHGSHIGCLYGKGTYFSNLARESNNYCRGSVKVILLSMVLLGDACVGNKSMDLPPENPITKRPYNSTVNSSIHPTIFVKYNHDEYYPAYAVHYT